MIIRIQIILIVLLLSFDIFSQTTRTYDMNNPDTKRLYGIGLHLIGDNGYKLNFFHLFPVMKFGIVNFHAEAFINWAICFT